MPSAPGIYDCVINSKPSKLYLWIPEEHEQVAVYGWDEEGNFRRKCYKNRMRGLAIYADDEESKLGTKWRGFIRVLSGMYGREDGYIMTKKDNMKLQEAWEQYVSQVFEIAEELFDEQVKSFCEANGYKFIAGNGTWWLGKDGKYGEEGIPKDVLDVLYTPVPGLPANDLGSLMPSYPDDDQQREGG